MIPVKLRLAILKFILAKILKLATTERWLDDDSLLSKSVK